MDMADRYLRFAGTAPGRFLTGRLGLPQPAPLRRDALTGPLLHLTAGKSGLDLEPVLARTGPPAGGDSPAAVVLDATGVWGRAVFRPTSPRPRPGSRTRPRVR